MLPNPPKPHSASDADLPSINFTFFRGDSFYKPVVHRYIVRRLSEKLAYTHLYAGIPTTGTIPAGATAKQLADMTGRLHTDPIVPRPGLRIAPAQGRAIMFW